jgi:hypothetical protein
VYLALTLPGATDIGYIKQMKTVGQLLIIKNNGIVRRSFILVEETFTLDDAFDQEEADNLEYSWHSDFYGIPEC